MINVYEKLIKYAQVYFKIFSIINLSKKAYVNILECINYKKKYIFSYNINSFFK